MRESPSGRQVDRLGLVVVDPLRAFTDPGGRTGRLFPDQFDVIVETVERLASFAAEHQGPKIWVTSLYTPGQFTGGDLDHPLAELCTDPTGEDCQWDRRLVPPADALVVTKSANDAEACPDFVQAIDGLTDVDALLVTGFWLSACVAATASSSAERLAGRVPVVVPLSLAATRQRLYDPSDDHPIDIDVTHQIHEMRRRGVTVCETPEAWSSAHP